MKTSLCTNLFVTLTLSTQAFGSQIDSLPLDEYAHLFKIPPKNESTLIADKAAIAFNDKYLTRSQHKAFAQSESGAWGFMTARNSTEEAQKAALDLCTKHNTNFNDDFPCEVIHIDNSWIETENRALKILATLPNWQPKDVTSLDLTNFLSEIRELTSSDQYELALSKMLWYFDNADKINPALVGVRNSFALGTWTDIGKKYPPAKTLQRYLASTLENKIVSSEQPDFKSILELNGINRQLGRDKQSIELFKWIDKHHPEQAQQVFPLFDKLLAENKEFSHFSKYLEPRKKFNQIQSIYLMSYKHDEKEVRDSATSNFMRDVATIVAVLTKNERHEEALDIVKRAKLDLDSAEFDSTLEQALSGKLP